MWNISFQLVNLFSTDSQRLFDAVPNGLNIVCGPLITVIALVYLLLLIGPTVLIGFSIIFLFYPLQVSKCPILTVWNMFE